MSNFWDIFLDPRTVGERRVTHDVESRIAASTSSQLSATTAVQMQVTDLRHQVHDLTKMVARLTAMVSVLAQGLGKSKAFDEQWAHEELRRILMQIDPPPPPADLVPPPAGGGSPYRGSVASQSAKPKTPEAPKKVRCAACKAEVEAASTTFTDEGVVCDACHKKIELAKLEKEGGT